MLQCRARRMLNPFRGVMQTIVSEHTDAATIDGLRWGLYITDESVYDFIDLNSVVPFHSTDVKYGEWSEKEGLVRSPLLPTMNHERVQERGDALLCLVEERSKHIPFALADSYERWLLDDADGQPLVLLESAYAAEEVRYNSNTLWRIGQRAEREFHDRDPAGGVSAVKRLQSLINLRSKRGGTVWVQRDEAGHGLVLPRPGHAPVDGQRVLARELFPSYGIRQSWQDEELFRLVEDYLRWLSPWLLLTVEANDSGIEKLVEHAVQYPSRLYQIRRMLNQELLARKEIKSALVQAELSRL